jgi:hypothetical protein
MHALSNYCPIHLIMLVVLDVSVYNTRIPAHRPLRHKVIIDLSFQEDKM